MEHYYIIGAYELGERILFEGTRNACIVWIWNNCDVGDLKMKAIGRWCGKAYYEDKKGSYEFTVDKFYP